MQTKIFSVEDGTLRIENNNINLHFDGKDKTTLPLASTDRSKIDLPLYILPSTLIRKPKTDEELAEEKYTLVEVIDNGGLDEIFINENARINSYQYAKREGFLAGLKARGVEFHLTREELELLISRARLMKSGIEDDEPMFDKDYLISSLTPPIHPHTITVEHDGNNYLWETLIPSYE